MRAGNLIGQFIRLHSGTFLLQTLIARQSTDEWKRFPAAVKAFIF